MHHCNKRPDCSFKKLLELRCITDKAVCTSIAAFCQELKVVCVLWDSETTHITVMSDHHTHQTRAVDQNHRPH